MLTPYFLIWIGVSRCGLVHVHPYKHCNPGEYYVGQVVSCALTYVLTTLTY